MTKNEKIIFEINQISKKYDDIKIELLSLCKKIDESKDFSEKEATRIVVVELMLTRKRLKEEYDNLINSIKNGNK
jgi:hypothetical protein